MARIESDYSETSGYLTSKEWDSIHHLLTTVKESCEKLAAKYKFQVFQDSRWPATGIQIKSGLKHKYIKLSLNANYLEDKKIFFELRKSTIISIPIVCNKILENRVVDIFSEEQLTDKIFINQKFENLIERF